MARELYHKSVLFDKSIESLALSEGKVIVDGTAGGGGHSGGIAEKIGNGKLISVDQDPDAIKVLHEKFDSFSNVTIVQDNFVNIKHILASLNIENVDGVLLDLGVSSHQLDDGDRGFSFHKDAPLDMRMSQSGMSAKDVVNTYSQQELASIIYKYGEEKFSRRIAENIVKARSEKEISTTLELVDIIRSSMPAAVLREGHPGRRTFQAIRIEVNGELAKLDQTLDDAFDSLKIGGRLSIITFHSLEDRMVKERFVALSKGCTCPRDFPVCVCGKTPRGKMLKAVAPSAEELLDNPRARSSRLRTIIRLK